MIEFTEASYLYSHFLKLADEGGGLDGADDKGLVLDKNDRFHPVWDIHKITGRWGSKPATQNWPKADTHGRPNLRAQVIAPEGRKLVGADLAQLEARIIGIRSGDPLLLSIFNGALTCGDCKALPVGKNCPKHDIHTYFACEVFPGFLDKPKDVKKVLRDIVKRGEYGGFYKGSIETLYKSMVQEFPDLTLRETARIVSIIGSRMPEVDRRHQRDMREAIQKKEIRSAILGRRRCFPMGLADPTVVSNHPVQSTGADVVNLGFIRICDELTRRSLYDVESRKICRAEPILQVHDALIFECDEDVADEVADVVLNGLSHTYSYEGREMYFPAETRIGQSWDQV
jgi:DNA polymerase I-like protein with 3'-5' exonuclease and polymerase domains